MSELNKVCQRGVDGSEGCGHGRVNDLGVCVEYLPQTMDYCRHFCDFSVRVPDERLPGELPHKYQHEWVRPGKEQCSGCGFAARVEEEKASCLQADNEDRG